MATKNLVKSEVEDYANFNLIRYAQVWEDAEVLNEALNINENDNILSIASARRKCFKYVNRKSQNGLCNRFKCQSDYVYRI